MIGLRRRNGDVERLWQHGINGLGGRELLGVRAHHLAVAGQAALEVAGREAGIGIGRCETCFGLSDVSPVTSPTLNRSRVWRSCSSRTSILFCRRFRIAVSRSTSM